MQSFDIVIIGINITSLAIACALKNSGLCILLIDINKKLESDNLITSSNNISLINLNSEKFLKHLNIWSNIISKRFCKYRNIEIFNKDKINILSFNLKENSEFYFGHIIENSIIYDAMYNEIKYSKNIILSYNIEIQEILFDKNQSVIKLINSDLIFSKLVIITNKKFNFTCNKAEKNSIFFWEYNYHSLIANVKTENHHNRTIRKILCNDGNIICLPMYDPFLNLIIWSLPLKKAENLKKTSDVLFNKKLSEYLNMRLGLCHLIGIREIFSLKTYYIKNFVQDRLVLIGNAAYSIYESSKQEINFNLEDVINLTNEILSLYKKNKDFGQHINLRKYERERKYFTTLNLIKSFGLHEFFSNTNKSQSFLLNLGFKILNNSLCIKKIIINKLLNK